MPRERVIFLFAKTSVPTHEATGKPVKVTGVCSKKNLQIHPGDKLVSVNAIETQKYSYGLGLEQAKIYDVLTKLEG
jgi:hypothetical protein